MLSAALIFLAGFAAGQYWPAETATTHHAGVPQLPANAVSSLVDSPRASDTERYSGAEAPIADSEIADQYNDHVAHAPDDISYAIALCDFTRQLNAEQLFLFLDTHAALEKRESQGAILRSIALMRLAQLDSQLAVNELKALRQRKQGSSELRDNLFDYLVGIDPAEAARSALAYATDTGEFEETFDHLLPKILDQDPDSVNDLAQSLLSVDDTALKSLGLSCAKEYLGFLCKCMQRDQALAWIESTAATTEQRTALLQSAIIELTRTNDLDGALLAYRALGATAEPALAGALASALVPTRPAEAFQLVAALAPGESRTVCFAEIVPKLLETQDPATVLTWLRSLPASSDLDPIYPKIAEALDKTDRAQAFACIESMSPDAKYRSAFRVQCAFGWLSADQDRARQCLPRDLVSLWEQGIALNSQVVNLIPGMEGSISFKAVQTP